MAPTLPSPVAASLIFLTPAQKIKNTIPSLLRRSPSTPSLLHRSTTTDSAKSAQTSGDGPFSSNSSSHMPSHSFAVILIPVFVAVLVLMTAGFFLYRRRERIRASNAKRAQQLQSSSSHRGNNNKTTHKGWYATPPDGRGGDQALKPGTTTTVTANPRGMAYEKNEKLPALPPPYEAMHDAKTKSNAKFEPDDQFEAKGMELELGQRKSTLKGLKHQSQGFTML